MKKFYQVHYKNWKGEWVADKQRFRTRGMSAALRLAFIKAAAALNGQATLQEVRK